MHSYLFNLYQIFRSWFVTLQVKTVFDDESFNDANKKIEQFVFACAFKNACFHRNENSDVEK